MIVIATALFTILLALVGIMISTSLSPLVFYILLLFSLIITFVLLFFGIWYFRFSTRHWKYITSDDRRAIGSPYFDNSHKSPYVWKATRQEEGMFYELNLGREYKIKGVHFDCGETSDAPIKSQILFIGKDNELPLLKQSGCPHIELPLEGDDFKNTTRLVLDKPIKAQKIRMTIIEPDTSHAWRVNAVYVIVSVLINHTIGRFILDRH